MSKRTIREVKLTTGGTSLELPPATKPPVQIRASMRPRARRTGPHQGTASAPERSRPPSRVPAGDLPGESHHRLRTTTAPRSTCGSEHEIVVCWLEVTLWSSPNDKCLAARRGWLERS